MTTYKVYFEGKALDLTKRNKSLANIIGGLEDPNDFDEIRKLAKKHNVYIAINPFTQDINGIRTLIHEKTKEKLIEICNTLADDI